jgi:hypothetical protein
MSKTWLLLEDFISRVAVKQLPEGMRPQFFEKAVKERVAGGRIYDAHIAETARARRSAIFITDNRRHFTSLMQHGIRVLTTNEFVHQQLTH